MTATISAAIARPRIVSLELANGSTVWLRELTLAQAWPYINGQGVNPDEIIRYSLCDQAGTPILTEEESLPLATALELLPHVLELNGLQRAGDDEPEEVEADLSPERSRG